MYVSVFVCVFVRSPALTRPNLPSDNRKPEVLKLMTSILNYSEEELEVLQRSKDKKWLSSLLAPASLGGAGDKDALPGQVRVRLEPVLTC